MVFKVGYQPENQDLYAKPNQAQPRLRFSASASDPSCDQFDSQKKQSPTPKQNALPWHIELFKEAANIGITVASTLFFGPIAGVLVTAGMSILDQQWTKGKVDLGTTLIESALVGIPCKLGTLAFKGFSSILKSAGIITKQTVGKTLTEKIGQAFTIGAVDGGALGYAGAAANYLYDTFKEKGILDLGGAHQAGKSAMVSGVLGGGLLSGAFGGLFHKAPQAMQAAEKKKATTQKRNAWQNRKPFNKPTRKKIRETILQSRQTRIGPYNRINEDGSFKVRRAFKKRYRIGIGGKHGQRMYFIRDPKNKKRVEVCIISKPGIKPYRQEGRVWNYNAVSRNGTWKAPPKTRKFWTKEYVGTSEQFYHHENKRWGVSLGHNAQSFEQSPLYLRLSDGSSGINLPDGKYLYAVRANGEVVIGKEVRGVHNKILGEGQPGTTVYHHGEGHHEYLEVHNHSMLLSRGQPMTPASCEDLGAWAAGEIQVVRNRFVPPNDQTGQLFGPNGLIHPDVQPHNGFMKLDKNLQAQYKQDAVEIALGAFQDITGHKLHTKSGLSGTTSVLFTEQHLAGVSHSLNLNVKDAQGLRHLMNAKCLRKYFWLSRGSVEQQQRLLEGLARCSKRDIKEIFKLTGQLAKSQALKTEQAVKLAIELVHSPEAIALYRPGNPLFIDGLSENGKRKIIGVFNQLKLQKPLKFDHFIHDLQQHPEFLKNIQAQRVSTSYLEVTLPNMTHAEEIAQSLKTIAEPHPTMAGTLPEKTSIIRSATALESALANLSQQSKSTHLPEIHLYEWLFHSMGKDPKALKEMLDKLKAVHGNTANISLSKHVQDKIILPYLDRIFAHAQMPNSNLPQSRKHQFMRKLLETYGVMQDDLYLFAKEKYPLRWSNPQILAAYAQKKPGMKQFLEDFAWFKTLPKATPPSQTLR